jgi:uncharacterized protein YciI
MFIVKLRFGENKSQAAGYMAGHNQWIEQGFDEGVFLLTGNLQPGLGGAVIVQGLSRDELEKRLLEDPFVREKVVIPEVIEIEPKKTDARLNFLLPAE